jgi:uncharacterized protein (DUF4213/DUF364 family)
MKTTLDAKKIDMLRDLPDMIPVMRNFYENWTIRIFNRKEHEWTIGVEMYLLRECQGVASGWLRLLSVPSALNPTACRS